MVGELGLIGKSTDAGFIHTTIVYINLRLALKKLDLADYKIEKALIRLRRLIEKHDVEGVKKELLEITTHSKEFMDAFKRADQNDLLSLKILAAVVLDIEGVLVKEKRMLKAHEKKGLGLTDAELEKQIRILQEEQFRIGDLTEVRIYAVLHRARIAVNGLTNLIDGGMDSAYFIKKGFFSSNSNWLSFLINYMAPRFQASGERREIRHADKELKAFEEHAKTIQKLLEQRNAARERKELRAEQAEEKKLEKAIKAALVDVYKIFSRNILMFERVIRTQKEIRFDIKKWVQKYEIPVSLGNIIAIALDQNLKEAKAILVQVNKDINQLFEVETQVRTAKKAA